ncbi:MAG: hypothetical protein V9G13_08270 [Marmoricola sp.]
MSQLILRVHSDVLSVDLPEATAHYDEIDPKLGDRLSQLIVDALHQIEAHPIVFAEYVTGFPARGPRAVSLPAGLRSP